MSSKLLVSLSALLSARVAGTGAAPVAPPPPPPGSGTSRPPPPAAGTITTIVGGGTSTAAGPGTSVFLNGPSGLVAGPWASTIGGGSVYVGAYNSYCVWRYDGRSHAAAPVLGVCGSPGAGPSWSGAATSALIGSPAALGYSARSGTLYVYDTNCVVLAVSPGGGVSHFAGTPGACASVTGMGGPATSASITGGFAIDFSPGADVVYIGATSYVLQVVLRTGFINVLAGNGVNGAATGDGGPATASGGAIQGIATGPDGSVYIACSLRCHRVRCVSPDGVITTVAGTGVDGSPGAGGGAATASRLSYPVSVSVDCAGNLLIGDQYNNQVYAVAAATGALTVVAGIGAAGFSGDGGPAADATFDGVYDVVGDAAGNVYIADIGNNRLRAVWGGAPFADTAACALSGGGDASPSPSPAPPAAGTSSTFSETPAPGASPPSSPSAAPAPASAPPSASRSHAAVPSHAATATATRSRTRAAAHGATRTPTATPSRAVSRAASASAKPKHAP